MQSGFHREAIKNKQLRYGTRGGARICTIVEEIVFACPTAHLTRRTSHSTPTAILPADCCQQIARTRSGVTSTMSWAGRKDSPPTSDFSNIYFYQGSSLFVPVASNNEQLGTGPGVRAGRQATTMDSGEDPAGRRLRCPGLTSERLNPGGESVPGCRFAEGNP